MSAITSPGLILSWAMVSSIFNRSTRLDDSKVLIHSCADLDASCAAAGCGRTNADATIRRHARPRLKSSRASSRRETTWTVLCLECMGSDFILSKASKQAFKVVKTFQAQNAEPVV